MSIKLHNIIILLCLASCTTKHTNMEICFEHIKKRIKSDSILDNIKLTPVDSSLHFLHLIHSAIVDDSKYDSICPKSIDKYFLENKSNSNTVNNLVLFQQFQAYLKHTQFDVLKAKDSAIRVEKKWKSI